MGTPFISLLEPTPLPWTRELPSHAQPKSAEIPRTFLDAMTVREKVFVEEQHVPQANEFDSDDPRSCHWVIYASVNQVVSPAVTDDATGEVVRPRWSETQTVPIGTVRLVPFPHPPHPRDGGVYVDGELVNAGEPVARVSSPSRQENGHHHHDAGSGAANETLVQPLTADEEQRVTSSILPFGADRPTDFHDGQEPYVKLGRLAVVKEFRGLGIARQLVRTAIEWMRKNPSYFDPSPAKQGLEQLGIEQGGTVPKWRGLYCCHAQEDAVKVWEKCGFQVDKAMGRWMEEGIPHVGMFLRVPVEPEVPPV
ncbi:hypothetical protein VTK56DRAFT_8851 [Thermocarpiscus australiensis]